MIATFRPRARTVRCLLAAALAAAAGCALVVAAPSNAQTPAVAER